MFAKIPALLAVLCLLGWAMPGLSQARSNSGEPLPTPSGKAARRTASGKPAPGRPAWVPAPASAAAADRDVVAFEQDGFIVLKDGPGKLERLDKGRYASLAPDASRLVYSPDTRIGFKLVDLTKPGRQTRFFPSAMPILEKCFSPDGAKLAWRTDTLIQLFAPNQPLTRPTTIISGLAPDQSLQGFTQDGTALVVRGLKYVTWYGLDGTIRRQEPIGTFTDAALASSGDASLPSPTDPHLLLVSCGVPPTPAYSHWAHDVSAALFLYDAASRTTFRLTPPAFVAVDPAWSPDGRRIYFAGLPESPAGGTHHISRINADGSGLTEIARGLRPCVGSRP